MEDREYLVSYEYGHGKAWAVVVADSPEDIVAAAPDLDVVTEPPVTMLPADLAALRARPVGLDGTLVQSVLDRRLA